MSQRSQVSLMSKVKGLVVSELVTGVGVDADTEKVKTWLAEFHVQKLSGRRA